MAVKLSESALNQLSPAIKVPNYDRASITEGIVHISVGGFHRAHQAVYMDDLFQDHGLQDWGLCGVGLMKHDQKMHDVLQQQDNLYTVVERSHDTTTARVIASIKEYLYAPDSYEALLQKLADPKIRIVTLTITEGGYFYNKATGEFNLGDPDINYDLAHPQAPRSALGILVEGLRRRKAQGLKPYTIQSCDNIQSNGSVTRKVILALAHETNPSLSQWIADEATFPNSMVDRITPRTTDADCTWLAEAFDIDDAWPVMTETFRQWVIEDKFCSGRPPWEKVGAHFTNNVEPYEEMKIRLLNAGHSALGYLGYLAGFRYIHEIAQDPDFNTYLQHTMDREITPLIKPLPGIDLEDYKRTLRARFANPCIKDQVARICLDGSSKMPTFVLPSIREELARDGEIRSLTLCVAAWFRYLSGTDENGAVIKIEDPIADLLQCRAREGGTDPSSLLSVSELFGPELRENKRFTDELSQALNSLYEKGARATLQNYL
jgi:mannitol 2-dehydrogenase